MSQHEQYRPPGRSNRSGRSNADNDVFEGLPVKQWGQTDARVSLAPPVVEAPKREDDKWADPPMPRDYQLLQPWTQQLLRLARSGRVGTKRKQDPDSQDEEKPDEEVAEDSKENIDDRGYITKKWKPVPESQLEPEHKLFEFLAKRRKGLSNMYGPDQQNGGVVPMRKTKVQKADANGEITVYEALVPEGQTVEGEVTTSTQLADVTPVLAAPGTVIEGVGIANEDGVVVAEHLKQVAPRRNRPPPKKKGGPGRGKKRVTFTNPDGSTYTTIVPNATKIVPQPGQTVKHVAKGEEATADITAEEAAAAAAAAQSRDGDEDDESDEGDDEDDEGDDDDDREEGELSEEDAPTEAVTPAPTLPENVEETKAELMEDVQPADAVVEVELSKPNGTHASTSAPLESTIVTDELPAAADDPGDGFTSKTELEPTESNIADIPSSPDTPLANTSHSRTQSFADGPSAPLESDLKPEQGETLSTVTDAAAPVEPSTEPQIEPMSVPSPKDHVEPEPVPQPTAAAAAPEPTTSAEPATTEPETEPAQPSEPAVEKTPETVSEVVPEAAPEPVPEPTTLPETNPEPVAQADPEPPVAEIMDEVMDDDAAAAATTAADDDADDDLLGNLEKHLGGDKTSS